jgi:hypothetical protein
MLTDAQKSAIERQIENLEYQFDMLKSRGELAEAVKVKGRIKDLEKKL